jgi:phage gpG-like protein
LKVATNISISINLKNLSENLVKGVLLRTAVKATEKAKEKAPVDTGALQGDISYVPGNKEAKIYSTMEYAVEQEYGGTGKKFTPYMRPAATFAGSQAEIDKSIEAEMRRLTS